MQHPSYVYFNQNPAEALKILLETLQWDQIAILVDENTRAHCLPLIHAPKGAHVIEIKSGEINKNLETCQYIWKRMTELGLSRRSVLINLGGGVIGDMGGFTAATYKRGIRFINIPTTLLAAVDANIGGKLGIDFMGFKNHLGVFQNPDAVVVSDTFLSTLPERELKSGFAEVVKHGLIYDASYFDEIRKVTFPHLNWIELIKHSIGIKHAVVEKDPKESGLRKILNFGHTLGHGVETWYLNTGKSLLHGEAISVGMIMETFLSCERGALNPLEKDTITELLQDIYGTYALPPFDELIELTLQDKKNQHGEMRFSLLSSIGQCEFDQTVDTESIRGAYNFYNSLR